MAKTSHMKSVVLTADSAPALTEQYKQLPRS